MYCLGNWNSARKVAKPREVCVCVCVWGGAGGGGIAGGLLPLKIYIRVSEMSLPAFFAGHYSESIRRKMN